jgi:hypothetical protein
MTMFDKQQKFETPDWFVKVLPLFGLFVQDRIRKENALLLARITDLESRMSEFQYCGVWHDGAYTRGNFVTHAEANMRTIEQAKHWIDEQRAKLGNPRITSVQAYLGDSMETVAIYAEVENQVEINGDLPLVAGFDLPAPITEKQF